jgi:hypothetical protein
MMGMSCGGGGWGVAPFYMVMEAVEGRIGGGRRGGFSWWQFSEIEREATGAPVSEGEGRCEGGGADSQRRGGGGHCSGRWHGGAAAAEGNGVRWLGQEVRDDLGVGQMGRTAAGPAALREKESRPKKDMGWEKGREKEKKNFGPKEKS